MNALLVFLGGGLGSLARDYVLLVGQRRPFGASVGTLGMKRRWELLGQAI